MQKQGKGEDTPLKYSSLVTEIEKIWAVIQKEDTEHMGVRTTCVNYERGETELERRCIGRLKWIDVDDPI